MTDPSPENPNRLKTWFLALRPWSFSMSAISVSIGTLWAGERGISWALYALVLGGMVALHGATNLINDYFDVKNEVDVPEAPTVRYRPHPLALKELGLRQVLGVSLLLYAVGMGVGIFLAATRGWAILAIGLTGAAVSLAYTARPVALKYHALGEIAVFLVWGPLAVSGAYYVQAQEFSLPLLLVSIPFGALVALVLLANNIRDTAYDEGQRIHTVPVVVGQRAGKIIYVALVALAFVSVILMSFFGPLSPWSLLVLLALPIAVPLCRMMYSDIPLDADARTAKLDTVFGVLLIVSLLINRLLT